MRETLAAFAEEDATKRVLRAESVVRGATWE